MSGLGTWDVTWERCPDCPAPVMPDEAHQCLDLAVVESTGDDMYGRRVAASQELRGCPHGVHAPGESHHYSCWVLM